MKSKDVQATPDADRMELVSAVRAFFDQTSALLPERIRDRASPLPSPPSRERCAELLALTDWDRHRMAATIEAMTRRPPAPDSPAALHHLAWLLATAEDPEVRDPQQAVQLAARANALTGGKVPVILETLAVAHAAAGDFEEAARIAQRGLERARAQGDEKLARELSRRLQSYQAAAAGDN